MLVDCESCTSQTVPFLLLFSQNYHICQTYSTGLIISKLLCMKEKYLCLKVDCFLLTSCNLQIYIFIEMFVQIESQNSLVTMST